MPSIKIIVDPEFEGCVNIDMGKMCKGEIKCVKGSCICSCNCECPRESGHSHGCSCSCECIDGICHCTFTYHDGHDEPDHAHTM